MCFLEFSFVSLLAVTFTPRCDGYHRVNGCRKFILRRDNKIYVRAFTSSSTYFFSSIALFASLIVNTCGFVYMQVYICVYKYMRMINKTLYMYNCDVCICIYV